MTAALRADLAVVAAYGKILPESLIATPRLGMINVHASLLPRYRGAAPIQRAVIDGERDTGVTIMRVVKALDAGDMLATTRRAIGPDETSETVERDLAELGAALLVTVVDQLAHGPIAEEPQDPSRVTYASRLTKTEGDIDWTLPAAAIHNRVRGLSPWPHAYTYLDGHRLIVLATGVGPERSAERSELAAAVDRALDRVRPDYRAVLVLRYQEGLEYQDIADVLGVPLGTVKTFLHRARRDLARELSATGWGLKPDPSAGRKAE